MRKGSETQKYYAETKAHILKKQVGINPGLISFPVPHLSQIFINVFAC